MKNLREIVDKITFLRDRFETNMHEAREAGDKEEFARYASTFALCEELLEWIKKDG